MDEFTLQRYVTARPAGVEEAAAMFLGAMVWRGARRGGSLPSCPAAPTTARAGWRRARTSTAAIRARRATAARLRREPRPGRPRGDQPRGRDARRDARRVRAVLGVGVPLVRAASAASGTLVRAFVVVDCSGLSLSTIRNIGVIKKVASIGPQYYAESTRCVWIVNAPTLFAAAWATVGPLLPAHTRKKVNVLGSGFLPTVSEHIDPSQLPGGSAARSPMTACPRAAPVPEGAAAAFSQAQLIKPSYVTRNSVETGARALVL